MAFDSDPFRRQLVLDELKSMRRLGSDRRDASTRLPVLMRTGPLIHRQARTAPVELNDAIKLPAERQ